MCKWLCGGVQAAMWWGGGGGHCIIVTPQSPGIGFWDLGLGLVNFYDRTDWRSDGVASRGASTEDLITFYFYKQVAKVSRILLSAERRGRG